MKTYKLTEAVSELERNPYAAFERIDDGLVLGVKETSHGMILSWDSGYRFLGFNDEFKEIIKSVPWQLAFKAWFCGHRIRVRLGEEERQFSTFNRFIDFTRKEMTEGEWYIETCAVPVERYKK